MIFIDSVRVSIFETIRSIEPLVSIKPDFQSLQSITSKFSIKVIGSPRVSILKNYALYSL